MQIHQVKRKHPYKKGRQVGRGGKRGKTSGRGTKGQNARAGHKLRPEIRDIIKKLPKLRGWKLSSFQIKPVVINLSLIEKRFENGEAVNPKTFSAKGLLKKSKGAWPKVKILGDGDFTKKITVTGCLVSVSAKEKIEKLGGTVK